MALGERGRNPLMARSTAEGAAAIRAAGALEADPSVRCRDELAAGFLGGFNATTLAKHRLTRGLFMRRLNQVIPGGYAYEVGRSNFIDDVVLGEAAAGIDELVLLGAGLDSRAYRMHEQLSSVRVIEVDHPATQATKRARLARLLGEIPEHVSFVSVDFTTDDLGERLEQGGHDESAATLFVWSGVSPYLSEQAVAATLTWVGSHTNPGSSIVFDACWAGAIDGSRDYYGAEQLRKAVAGTGEPLRWGIPEGEVEPLLERFGLRAQRVLDEQGASSAYLTRADGSTLGRPYGFGVLAHARVAGVG